MNLKVKVISIPNHTRVFFKLGDTVTIVEENNGLVKIKECKHKWDPYRKIDWFAKCRFKIIE